MIEPVRRVGAAEAGMLRHDHVEVLATAVLKNGSHTPAPPRAMQEQQRRALAAAHEPQAAAIDGLKGFLHGRRPAVAERDRDG